MKDIRRFFGYSWVALLIVITAAAVAFWCMGGFELTGNFHSAPAFALKIAGETFVDKPSEFASSFYIAISTVILALFTATITMYIFLYQGMIKQKDEKPYAAKCIMVASKQFALVIIICALISLISLVGSVILANDFQLMLDSRIFVAAYTGISVLAVGVLTWLIIMIIQSNRYIEYVAGKQFKEYAKKITQPNDNNKSVDERSITRFIKQVNDIEIIINKILQNCEEALSGYLSDESKLEYALNKSYSLYGIDGNETDKKTKADIEGETPTFSKRCMDLFESRNCLLTYLEYTPDYRNNILIKSVLPFNKAEEIEEQLYHKFLINGNFDGVSFSELYCRNEINNKGKDFKNISFKQSSLIGANFSQRRLSNVSLENCNLACSKFIYVYINQKTSFEHSSLVDSRIANSVIIGSNFRYCDLSKAVLYYSRFEDCDFFGLYANYTNFRFAQFKKSNFRDAVLIRSDFSHSTCSEETCFENCMLSDSLWIDVDVIGDEDARISFRNSQFLNAQFINGTYSNCDFTGAVFTKAALNNGACFKDCIVTKEMFDLGDKGQFFNCVLASDEKDLIQTKENTYKSFKEIVFSRHSTRAFMRNVEVPKEVINQAIEAARWAPSSKNRQPWYFTLIEDKSYLAKISEWLSDREGALECEKRTAEIIKTIPALVLISVENKHESEWNPDLLSVGAAVENLILSLADNSCQSLWICDILAVADRLKEDSLPKKGGLIAAVCIGYEDGNGRSPRKPLIEISNMHQ